MTSFVSRSTLEGAGREEAMMRSLRCLVGRHHWNGTVVRREGGEKFLLQRCTRCGQERRRVLALDGDAMPNTGDRTTPRPLAADGWDVGE